MKCLSVKVCIIMDSISLENTENNPGLFKEKNLTSSLLNHFFCAEKIGKLIFLVG